MDKQERINEVFNYLRSHGIIHTQKDLAAAIGSTPQNISKILKGDPKVLTDSICVRIQKTFKMISADWLITGDGEMVIATDNNKTTTEQMPLPDYSSLVNAAIAAKDETISSLKRELVSNEESAKEMLEAKNEIIASLKRELNTKNALVKALEQQISSLSFEISTLKEKRTGGYPFAMGVAEDGNITATK